MKYRYKPLHEVQTSDWLLVLVHYVLQRQLHAPKRGGSK